MLHLDFLNKNLFRKYPVRAESTWTTEAGTELPLSLFTSLRLSTLATRKNVYIKFIVIKTNYVNVSLVHRDDPVTNPASPEYGLGCFSGYLTSDYQDLTFTSFDGFTDGTMTVGKISDFASVIGGHQLSYTNGKIEDALIFCYVPPVVTNLLVKNQEVTGNITLSLENLTATTVNPDVSLAVTNSSIIASRGDLNSIYNNCGLPIIARINTVPPDENGNIDIWGIAPIEIHVDYSITVDTGALGVDDICTKAVHNIPPENLTDTYYTDIMTATQMEWQSWPQYYT